MWGSGALREMLNQIPFALTFAAMLEDKLEMTFNGRPTLRIPSGSGHCQMAGFSVNAQLYSGSRIRPPLNLETLLGIG